jgi:hypothetical protein
LFNAKTLEDLAKIEALGVNEVAETSQEYLHKKMTDAEKFCEMERFARKPVSTRHLPYVTPVRW